MIGERIAAEAEAWIDVPFKWQGRVKAGCDCKGLIAGVAKACGRAEGESLPALAGDYATTVDERRLKAGLAQLFDEVDERQPGDILLLRLGGKAQHLAICAPTDAKPDRIIEAMPSGPAKVRPGRASDGRIDSIWRWRD